MKHINGFFSEMFKILLFSYIFLFVMELIKEGVISLYLNLDYLLAAVIISGILKVLTNFLENKPAVLSHPTIIKTETYIIFGFILNTSIFLVLKDLGIFGLGISFLVSVIFVLILYLAMRED